MHHCTSPLVAELLVESAPDSVSTADDHGLLPAHYAVMRNSIEVLSVLVQQKGSAGPDDQGMQPLHYAVIWVCSIMVSGRMHSWGAARLAHYKPC